MRLIVHTALFKAVRWARTRASAEHGFTMVVALGVLLVTSLLLTAVFYALQGEIRLGNNDLASKRAYSAATAGVNAYLYDLNQNPNYWGTCSNDVQSTALTVPGSSDGESYTFQPVYANGNTSCTSNVISSLVDDSTGTIRMLFTGSAGANPVVTRSIVVSFRMNSPLDFLYYTNYESSDSSISGFSNCNVYYRVPGGRNTNCNIYWVTGDVINGPMYTNDQYLVASGQSPTFGRDPADKIESSEPLSGNCNIFSTGSCGSAVINGTPVPDAPTVSTPSDNSELLTDAQNYGNVYYGTTTIVLSGTTATVQTCTTSAASSCSTPSTVDLTAKPIIYVNNATGCSPPAYTPFGASYPKNSTNFYGCTGDVYVSGNYTTPVTIAAMNNIIINGNITTSTDGSGNLNGTATLGLVANEFVRVMHGINGTVTATSCGTPGTNNSTYTLTNPVIDAAILALNHSFIVDNYTCGATPGANGQPGTLTVDGAIAQDYRGPVGTGTASTGYLKNYSYDDRLANILPPYLFDISNSGWHISRETLCVTGSTSTAAGCNAPG